jgi:hypothetical protein
MYLVVSIYPLVYRMHKNSSFLQLWYNILNVIVGEGHTFLDMEIGEGHSFLYKKFGEGHSFLYMHHLKKHRPPGALK